jgi:N-acetylglucosaminyldiphosphoundecaprenol N-acetyl-beta-D-mannosaminyltransferase
VRYDADNFMINDCKKVNICGVEIDNITFKEAIEEIGRLVSKHIPAYIVTPNVDVIVKLQDDAKFREIYLSASLVLVDGVPLLWGAKFLGTPLKEKISGSDLFPKLCGVAAERGYKVFFLGGREGAGQKAAEVLKRSYSSLQVAGYYSPPFGFENKEIESEKIVRMIKEVKPDILFVGLGSPKQEKWIYKYKQCLPMIKIFMAIGATINFEAGLICRAPKWMSNLGIEWFYRLLSEPQRLWKRYLLDDLPFFWLLLKQKLNLYKDPLAKN